MHCAKLISHLNIKTHLTRCEQATFYLTKILFHHSNHEGRTSRWLDSTAKLFRENAAIFLCSWSSPLCSLPQLESTRYAAHSTWCQAGSPQWFTRLPSHRQSCCVVRGSVRRADVGLYHTGGNMPGDWRAYRPTMNKSPSGTSRSVFVLTLQWQSTKNAPQDGN